MFILIITLALVGLGTYCSYVEHCRRLWKRAKPTRKSGAQSAESLAVVVALHDEERNAERLSASLKKLPADVSIFLVCDHCSDNTYTLLSKAFECDARCRVIDSNALPGKKHAQRCGIEMADAEWVLLTDADCVAQLEWAEAMISSAAEDVSMVMGPVKMQGNGNAMTHVFELEFLSLQIITAAKALDGDAVMCNGANLMVRRSEYLAADICTHYASGDDMFLLSDLKLKGRKIAYCASPDAVVSTSTPQTLGAFVRQRTRWMRKATGYTDMSVMVCAHVVFWGNMVWPFLLVMSWWTNPWLWIAAFGIKTLVDYRLLRAGAEFWKVRTDVGSVLMLALAYPFYVLTIALMSVFRSRQKW